MVTNLTSIDIAKFINDTVETWRTMIEIKGVTLTCFIDEQIKGDYLIDSRGFHTCLNTVLSNAAHYTDNGRVHVHVTIENSLPNQPQNLSIIVADTGQGMSNEQQIKIQSGDNETRLTDAIKTAIDLGGNITFNSSHGRGSEFIFTYPCPISNIIEIETSNAIEQIENTLSDDFIDIDINYEDIPIHAPPSPLQPQEEISAEGKFNPDNLRGLRVLIVDDTCSNQDVIKIFLTPEGCECFCTAGGEETLTTLKTQMVDIILIDIRMPGMNGIETISAIRGSDLAAKNVPIIALTGDNSAKTNAACMAVGADLFLTKPVLCRDLIEAIRFVRRYTNQEETPQSEVA